MTRETPETLYYHHSLMKMIITKLYCNETETKNKIV